MAGPETTVRGLLYGGEDLIEETRVGTASVGVTTHRVIVLTPEGDGPRVHEAARPNVTGVAVGKGGSWRAGRRSARAGASAIVLLAAGALLDLEGVVGPIDAPAGAGLEGIVGTINVLIATLGLVDEFLLGGGLVAGLVAVGFLARFIAGRSRYLTIRVAGEEPIRLPIDREETAAPARVRSALEKASNGSAD